MALADIAVIEFVQAYNNEEIRNVYTYERLNTSALWNSLLQEFEENIVPATNGLQSGLVTNRLMRLTVLGDLSVLEEEVLTGGGAWTGTQMLPIHDCINFTLRPAGRQVRSGKKRISGLSEDIQSNGIVNLPQAVAAMDTLRSRMGSRLPDGAVNADFRPVIVKRVLYTTTAGTEAYRLPKPGDALTIAEVNTVTVNPKITTQRSRGNGR